MQTLAYGWFGKSEKGRQDYFPAVLFFTDAVVHNILKITSVHIQKCMKYGNMEKKGIEFGFLFREEMQMYVHTY